MLPHSLLAWRSSGAEPMHKGKTRVIMRVRFDSPHLHNLRHNPEDLSDCGAFLLLPQCACEYAREYTRPE